MDEFNISKITKRNIESKPPENSAIIKNDSSGFQETLDRVTLSSPGKIPIPVAGKNKRTSEIRYDLVNKYRANLKNGDYEIKALEIAEKMIQKIRDEKNNPII